MNNLRNIKNNPALRKFFGSNIPIENVKQTVISGVSGSLNAFLLDYIFKTFSKQILLVGFDNLYLEKLADDLEMISPDIPVSHFAQNSKNSTEDISKTLTLLADGKEFIVMSTSDNLSLNVVSKDQFKNSIIGLEKNTTGDFNKLLDDLNQYNYIQSDFVEENGQYSVRGGIVDIYPDGFDSPVRVEFFGDTIESIREFDPATQRSLKEIDSIKFGINLNTEDDYFARPIEQPDTILNFIPEDVLLVIAEPEALNDGNEKNMFTELIANHNTVFITSFRSIAPLETTGFLNAGAEKIILDSSPQPEFHSNLKQLYSDLQQKISEGFTVYILCSDKYQSERIKTLIEDFEDENLFIDDESIHKDSDSDLKKSGVSVTGKFIVIPESLHNGFVTEDSRLAVYTEHQIFGRYFRQTKKVKSKFRGLSFNELKELKPGDYVVHRDFGVGVYSGLRKIKVGNSEQEVMMITYEGSDKIFVNLNYIHLVKKYSSTEGFVPKLTKLGGGEWDRVKQRAKKKVKDIARDLILLYAKRKSLDGYSFPPDTHWQKELEASFMYEDTPDQIKATDDFKLDMESPHPMDRLICGDVGFGKTEVAVRAAFKAVLDNKQVAILVPTTILALQHYNTFRDRLSPFAVDVGVITRLQKKPVQKELLKKLEEGKINIIIGTHRILSKDIKFKDLGLLIIDEEQRFGVKAKETLRALKPNIDTLTLTATPIPRTLNFSLLGARDLSIINTPPKNRKPVQTEIINLEWAEIGRIIRDELNRGGQVYFVNDKIDKMYSLAEMIKDVVPSAKVAIAHGQMDAKELEDVMIDFIEKKVNVLVCTKIIESGLDIPNVNTIIINHAENFGLAELYQLRGRVGRSDQQAYAYLISPKGKLTKSAVKRLQAIEEFTELGSGINLALRDMEIRGVGNLLGKEQSGYVQQIGFDLFMSIIDEAVSELKENEFRDLFKDEGSEKMKKIVDKIEVKQKEPAIVENDLNALIPKDYITNDTERLNIYKRLYEAVSVDEVDSISNELKDRFGEYLEDVENLLGLVKLRITATDLGLEKIQISGSKTFIHFPPDKESDIYKGEFFGKLIESISNDKQKIFNIENDKDRLIVSAKIGDGDKERIEAVEKVLWLTN